MLMTSDIRFEPGWHTAESPESARALLQRQAFAIHHPLAGHPLFTIEALTRVAEAAAKRPGDLWADAGDLSLADKWGTVPMPNMPIPRLIDRIETAKAWIVMKHVEKDPAYKAVLDEYEAFVRETAGPELSGMLSKAEMLVFITSPGRKTPYHFDAEFNTVVQLQGTKDLWVCDPADRSITPESEIEAYHGHSISAGTYKPQAETVARQFALYPGSAVHVPSYAPHWVQNHDNVSVTLSLNMELPRWHYADVHHANYLLRRLGISPRPPGQSILLDRSKAAVIGAMRQAKRTASKLKGG